MKNIKILVVEDETHLANTLIKALQYMFGPQATIVFCRTAEAALDQLSTEPFDVLITDWHLPGVSGLALTLQARKLFPDLRIVFMTASHVMEIEERVRQVANVYITKPFTVARLTEEIQRLF